MTNEWTNSFHFSGIITYKCFVKKLNKYKDREVVNFTVVQFMQDSKGIDKSIRFQCCSYNREIIDYLRDKKNKVIVDMQGRIYANKHGVYINVLQYQVERELTEKIEDVNESYNNGNMERPEVA